MQFTSLPAFSREIAGLVAATAPAIAAVHAGRHSSSAVFWRDGLFAAASETIEKRGGHHADLAIGTVRAGGVRRPRSDDRRRAFETRCDGWRGGY